MSRITKIYIVYASGFQTVPKRNDLSQVHFQTALFGSEEERGSDNGDNWSDLLLGKRFLFCTSDSHSQAGSTTHLLRGKIVAHLLEFFP